MSGGIPEEIPKGKILKPLDEFIKESSKTNSKEIYKGNSEGIIGDIFDELFKRILQRIT